MFPKTRHQRLINLKLDIPLVLKFTGELPQNHEPQLNVNSKLVETGIKFFLFQRSQIPIPFDKILGREKLPTSTSVTKDNFDMMEIAESNESELVEMTVKEAIRIKRAKRKEVRAKRLAEKKYHKMMEKEGNILCVWEPLFETLGDICKEPNFMFSSTAVIQTTEAILMLLGPSILNPKEIIILEYLKHQGQIENSLSKCPTAEDLITITRSFYKNLIMSTAFTEFTDKPLRSTYSHIILLASEPRPRPNHLEMEMENPTVENLTLLENPNFLKSIIFPEQNSNKRIKILHMKLNFQHQMQTSESTISSVFPCNKIKSIFDADIDEANRFCYQVNLKYKGVLSYR